MTITNDNYATYEVTNPGTLEITELQKADVQTGDMYLATKNTLNQYTSSVPSEVLNNTFIIDGTKADFGVPGVSVTTSPYTGGKSIIANVDSNVKAEKERIRIQKETNNPQNKEGFFALGTVYLDIPPTQISITDEAMNFRFQTLRQPGESVATSGKSTTRIDLDIVFNGINDINNKLRPLIAQLKTVPFIQIDNEYVRSVVNPSSVKLKHLSYAEAVRVQAENARKDKELLDKTIFLDSCMEKVNQQTFNEIDKLRALGVLTNKVADKLKTGPYLTNPNEIPASELTDEDYSVDIFGTKRVDISKWISRNVIVQGNSDDMFATSMSLSKIRDIQAGADDIGYQQRALGLDKMEQRFRYRTIVGVMSQMSISTVPGYPETLSCKLSLYVFNYDPFSIDFGYISNYNKNSFTTDITQCDLFIDWYTKRWLTPSNDIENPSLGLYSSEDDLTFRYATKISPVGTDFGKKAVLADDFIEKEMFSTNEDFHLQGISVSMKNTIQFLPILSGRNPTCQYLGNMSADVKLIFESTSLEVVKRISKMIERVRKMPREDNRITRNSFVSVSSSFLSLFAMKYFSLDDFSVDTVPGNPGLYSISLDLIEYKLSQQDFQQLKREGITTNEDIIAAAKFVIEKANEYAMGVGTHGGNPAERFLTYYNLVLDRDVGWFNKHNNVLSSFSHTPSFANNWGSTDELKRKLWSRMNTIKIGDRLTSSGLRALGQTKDLLWTNSTPAFSPANNQSLVGAITGEDAYGDAFSRSLRNDPKNSASFWLSNMDLIPDIVAIMKREELVEMLTINQNQHPALAEWLGTNLKKSPKEIDAGKEYCYPDLELPRYVEIPNGSDFITTKQEAGVPRKANEDNYPAQTENAVVDPDFFMYKGSLWKMADRGNNDQDLGGVDRAIGMYKSFANSNYRHRTDKNRALDERQFAISLNDTERGLVDKSNFDGTVGQTNLTTEEIKNISGKDFMVSGVSDGRTLSVTKSILTTDGHKTFQVKLDGILTAASPIDESVKNGAPVDKNWEKQRDFLASAVMGKKVKVFLGEAKVDKEGNLLATVMVESAGGFDNVNSMMLDNSRDLKLRKNVSPDDPLSEEYAQRFLQSHENYIKAISTGDKVDAVIRRSVDFATGVPGAGGAVGLITGLFTTKEEEAVDRTAESLGVGLRDAVTSFAIGKKFLSGFNLGGFSAIGGNIAKAIANFDQTNDEITSDINSMVKNIAATTNNNGINRFNRDGDNEIETLSKKIRESQKDDILRVSRAFPTFKLYFIEEDMPQWKRWDDTFSYQAVMSIDITKARTEAADTAVITLLNTLGTLDRSYFGLHDPEGNYFQKAPIDAVESYKQETADELNLSEFVLKPGTLIKLKMGYSSDPDLLETVFTGTIAEVNSGDTITVVAQGFGVELLGIPPQQKYRGSGPYVFGVLNKLITSPETRHFGKLQWFPEGTTISSSFSMTTVWDQSKNRYVDPTWYRNIGGVRCILGMANNTKDDNIWMPSFANSIWYRFANGGWYDFIVTGKTIWEIFREVQIRMPGYITTVLPFDNRATIYFGPSDFMYWYTNQNSGKNKDFYTKVLRDQPKSAVDKTNYLIKNGLFSSVPSSEVVSSFNKLGNFLTKLYNNDYAGNAAYQEKVMKLVNSLKSGFNTLINTNDNRSFCETIAQADILDTPDGDEIKKRLDEVSKLLKYPIQNTLRATSNGNQIKMDFIGGDAMLKSKDGSFYSVKDAVSYFDKTVSPLLEELNPSRKLVRGYHFKDSYHHIIGNTITATSEYLKNRVVVEYGNESEWSGKVHTDSVPKFHNVTAQVDSEIWPEKRKTKLIYERNARDPWTAWNYAQGHLVEEMRKMYSGSLVLLGDPSIKPYDTILIADYFSEMFGPIEVEQVVHHFSPETGFVTTVTPSLLCHANNTLQQGSLTVAGAYQDTLTRQIENIMGNSGLLNADIATSIATFGLAPSLRKGVANVAFWVSNLTDVDRRESLSFSPLMYAGRPYIAGVEGMKRRTLFEVVSGRLAQFTIQNARMWKTMQEVTGSFQKWMSGGLR